MESISCGCAGLRVYKKRLFFVISKTVQNIHICEKVFNTLFPPKAYCICFLQKKLDTSLKFAEIASKPCSGAEML